ncbi:MAG: PSD1 and planctomycete cytochrome C domain-containing protein [Pirellulaceae bacterium]
MPHAPGWTGLVAVVCSLVLAGGAVAAEGPLTFEQHARPILKAYCFQCHGEEEHHEANLDVRQVRLLLKGGDSGAAIAPGQASASLIVERIAAGEMPPEGKPVPAKDLETLRAWLDQGAKTARPEPETLSVITDDERSFWSLQPVRAVSLPTVGEPAQLASFIDALLLAKLEEQGLSFSPAADKRVLVRRAYYDLAGLPPTPEEVDAFLADDAPDAWQRLVDRLLASPQYGERWGRHWLDVAGYADSDGYTERDPERKYAFKYRDYVIRALNADKPWDAMIREQLAGDELLSPPYENLSSEQADLLAATGFLRMAADGTADGTVDQQLARNDVLAETLKIVTSSLLGLTVGCAQCHNHRYDPIPQADYYRLRAVFEPAYDPKNWRAPAARLVSLWTDEVREQAAAVDAELKQLTDEQNAELDKIVQATFDAEVAKLPEAEHAAARAARDTEAKDRSPEQKQLLKDHPSLNVNRGSAYLYDRKRVAAFNKDYDERTKAIKDKRPAEDFVPCLTEVPGRIPQSFVFFRGDISQPKQEVQPGVLTVLADDEAIIPADDPALPTSGRRLAFANWLTSGQHRLVGRVLANRFWMHHFGRGIVATPGDFGILGEQPSHPELLDWLATRFVADGWELKRHHRLLMHSTAYRQSSQRTEELDRIDSENRLLGRMSIRRIEAETLRDSMLAATGQLNGKMWGSPVPVTVDEVGQVIVGLDNRDSAGRPDRQRDSLGGEEFRRSVYVQVRRSLPLSMLETFDAPLLTPNCEVRDQSTVAPQSLLLMNNAFVIEQAERLAERAIQQAEGDLAAQIRLAWRLALVHEPSEAQLAAAVAFVTTQQQEFAKAGADPKIPAPPPATRALAAFCQALVSSNAFLYVD